MLELLPEQHFTQPPPGYTEASLVKTLEELGIGRLDLRVDHPDDPGARVRAVDQKRFMPEDVAEVVTDKPIQHFLDIVDVNFTARMEEELDEIAEGKATRVAVLQDFYVPFAEELALAEEKFERYLEETEELCPKCPTEGGARAPAGAARPVRQVHRARTSPTATTSGTSTGASVPSRSSWRRRARTAGVSS